MIRRRRNPAKLANCVPPRRFLLQMCGPSGGIVIGMNEVEAYRLAANEGNPMPATDTSEALITFTSEDAEPIALDPELSARMARALKLEKGTTELDADELVEAIEARVNDLARQVAQLTAQLAAPAAQASAPERLAAAIGEVRDDPRLSARFACALGVNDAHYLAGISQAITRRGQDALSDEDRKGVIERAQRRGNITSNRDDAGRAGDLSDEQRAVVERARRRRNLP